MAKTGGFADPAAPAGAGSGRRATPGSAANFAAMAMNPGEMPPPYVTYSPLPPLALLMLSGLYLFALPYTAKARRM